MIKLSQFDVQIIMRVTMKSSLSPEREFLRDVYPTSRRGRRSANARPVRRNQPPRPPRPFDQVARCLTR